VHLRFYSRQAKLLTQFLKLCIGSLKLLFTRLKGGLEQLFEKKAVVSFMKAICSKTIERLFD